ncbi:PDR/VanB family oxidoreductase [Rhodococcus olei]|uniref:PDR/VanB family oxidoreductase n=2 Tax=Rhodococcus olei TaxID=2161675 RepID=A0ABP8PS51_9NOCA
MTHLDIDPQRVYPLLVQQVTWEAEDVVSIRLIDPTGSELPAWAPGAHLDLVLPSGKVRQYSLCGDPADRSAYTVAVLRDEQGRGGSREIHDGALVGRTLSVRGPRNHFRLVDDAPSYLFVAGGIGITPLLAMAREVERRGMRWRLVYGGRSRTSMAFLGELDRIGSGKVEVVPQDVRGMLDLDTVLADEPAGSAVYCCGPEGLIRAVEERVDSRFAPDALHVERFGASVVPGAVAAAPERPEDTAFEVELRRTGAVLDVPADRTLLDVVRDSIPDFLSDCEEGFCGACEVRVLEGEPDHHDLLLSDQERACGDRMMICVGRSRSERLVLDL